MTKEVTIAGKLFTIPQPFAAGHVLTEGEARAMNQVFSENVRNNTATKVKAALEGKAKEGDPTAETIEQFVADYAAGYEFTIAVAGERRSTDPLDIEATAIARELLKDLLKRKGLSYTKVAAEVRDAKVAEIAGKDSVIAEAKKRLAAKQKAAAAMLEGLDIDDVEEAAPAEPATAAAE